MSARRRWKRRPRHVSSPFEQPFTVPQHMTSRMVRRDIAAKIRPVGFTIVGWEPLAGGGLTFHIDRVEKGGGR